MKIMRPVAERRKRIEAALAEVGEAQEDVKTDGAPPADAKTEGAPADAKLEDDGADAKDGAGGADAAADMKSPSKEEGAVREEDDDAKGDAKDGEEVADSKGEPAADDAKGDNGDTKGDGVADEK
jgi:hypothetical protein